MTSDDKRPQVHLIDRRKMAFGTVCGVIVSARFIGIYTEGLITIGSRVLIRREVYTDTGNLVRRGYRCSCCFRRHERVL